MSGVYNVVHHIIIPKIWVFSKLSPFKITLYRSDTIPSVWIVNIFESGIIVSEIRCVVTVLLVMFKGVKLDFGMVCYRWVLQVVNDVSLIIELKVKLSKLSPLPKQLLILLELLNLLDISEIPSGRLDACEASLRADRTCEFKDEFFLLFPSFARVHLLFLFLLFFWISFYNDFRVIVDILSPVNFVVIKNGILVLDVNTLRNFKRINDNVRQHCFTK